MELRAPITLRSDWAQTMPSVGISIDGARYLMAHWTKKSCTLLRVLYPCVQMQGQSLLSDSIFHLNLNYLIPRGFQFSCCQLKLPNKQLVHNYSNKGRISWVIDSCLLASHISSVVFFSLCSLLGYTEQYLEYDPFLTPPDPSNPWISDDTTLWELEARWAHFSK